MLSYTVKADSDIPYYKQLVDAIRADIHSGRLSPGEKLPTVRELADSLCLARGTIKRAYDELGKTGDLEMSRGRGTFVRYQPENSESRKERAMAAIDKMFDQLEAIGLSAQETDIFLRLTMQERTRRTENLRVALVECNREVLEQVTEQLRVLTCVELHPHLLDEVVAYPYEISDDMDVIVTTAAHYETLLDAVPARDKLMKVALRLAPETVRRLSRLPDTCRAGVFCHSARFGGLLQTALAAYAPQLRPAEARMLEDTPALARALSTLDVALLPRGYERYCAAETLHRLSAFADAHELVLCSYEIDQGSYMYVEERVRELLRERGKLT